ncbi:MAG: class I SAM-dependent methyltransferase [Methanomassiliicoccales archaeon]|nr:class I SAM-dependent methyltransferase [Methanomassiliicoccales archaeon]NYT15655.1 class I SAM-dependent methyltransferase [Methanomassiliicoccales archaeon]
MKNPFDSVSNEFDEWYKDHPIILALERGAIGSMNLAGSGLDIGCGTGALSPAGTLCLDPSLPMLHKAKMRGFESILGMAESLPFHDQSFDFVIMTTTLCFLEHPQSAIIESTRVLKTGGYLVICIIPRDSSWGVHYIRKGELGHPIYCHARFLTVKETERMMENASIELDKVASCLHSSPEASLDHDTVLLGDDKGGFVCLRGRKKLKQGDIRR